MPAVLNMFREIKETMSKVWKQCQQIENITKKLGIIKKNPNRNSGVKNTVIEKKKYIMK
jgi:hypothetical protein